VVHADPVPDEPGQRLAEAGTEPEAADELGDPVALLAAETLMLVSAWARSSAAACVKCTTYTGAWCVVSSSSSVSCSGVTAHW